MARERADYGSPIRETGYVLSKLTDAAGQEFERVNDARTAESERQLLLAELAHIKNAQGRVKGVREWLARRETDLVAAIADLQEPAAAGEEAGNV